MPEDLRYRTRKTGGRWSSWKKGRWADAIALAVPGVTVHIQGGELYDPEWI